MRTDTIVGGEVCLASRLLLAGKSRGLGTLGEEQGCNACIVGLEMRPTTARIPSSQSERRWVQTPEGRGRHRMTACPKMRCLPTQSQMQAEWPFPHNIPCTSCQGGWVGPRFSSAQVQVSQNENERPGYSWALQLALGRTGQDELSKGSGGTWSSLSLHSPTF